MDPQGRRCDKHIDSLHLPPPPTRLPSFSPAPCTQHMPHFIHPTPLRVSLKVPPPSLSSSISFHFSPLSLFILSCLFSFRSLSTLSKWFSLSLSNSTHSLLSSSSLFHFPSLPICLSLFLFHVLLYYFLHFLKFKVSIRMGKERGYKWHDCWGLTGWYLKPAHLLGFSPYRNHL